MNIIDGKHESIQEIYPNLYLGSLAAVRIIATKTPANVHWTVISLLHSFRLLIFVEEILKIRISQGTCTHIIWKLTDKPDTNFLNDKKLKPILQMIDEAVGNNIPTTSNCDNNKHKACLVHCAEGVSRSVTLCAIWLISRKKSLSLQDAMETIRKVRPEAMPNLGFIATLHALEQCNGDIDKAIERQSTKQTVTAKISNTS